MPGFVWHVFSILMGLLIVLFLYSHRADPWAVDRFQPSYQALYGMRSGRTCQAVHGMHSVSGVVSVRGTWYLGSVTVAMPGWYGHLLGGL